MPHIDLTHNGHTYRIHCRPPRKNNRRLRLSIDLHGHIHLSRPIRSTLEDAHAFAANHLDWIAARATPLAAQSANPYRDGSTHWLLGTPYTLRLYGDNPRLTLERDTLISSNADAATLAARFKTLHRTLSEQHLPELVHSQLPHCPWVRAMPPIRYRAMRKTWGTCASNGILTFNTRLIQYPRALIEHVIVHELCHLQELNHSPAFYGLMQRAQPDHRARQQALAAFARQLPA